ncbi:MAG TPA: IPT/TIG domain-containing protein [Stenomitos sp.]
MNFHRLLVTLALGASLIAGCTPVALITSTTDDQPPTTKKLEGLTGRIINLNGQPAANVPVTGYLIANNTASLVSNNSASIISNNSANLVSNNTASYRTQAGSRVAAKTDQDGYFAFPNVTDNYVNIEAVLSDDVKAIKTDVASKSSEVMMKLAYTGSIRGHVKSTSSQVTDFLGVDVFIPGTGYVAKTDSQGNYEIPHVPVGRFYVVAMHPDLGRGYAEGVTVVSKTAAQAPDIELSTKFPTLTAIAPTNGAPGQTVTLTGENFGVSIGKQPEVLFNGVQAQVTSKSDTELQAVVPNGALNGLVTVKVAGLNSTPLDFKVIKDLAIFPDAQNSLAQTPSAVAPTSDVMPLDQPRTYLARALDTDGAIIPSPAVTWSSSMPAVGTVDGTGKLTATTVGTLELRLAAGSRSAALPVEVVGAINRLTVTPNPVPTLVSYPVGATPDTAKAQCTLVAQSVFTAGGSRVLPVTWSTTDPRITITSGGLITTKPGAEAGTASVTVQSVVDPRRSLQVQVPVVRQGSLAIEIE